MKKRRFVITVDVDLDAVVPDDDRLNGSMQSLVEDIIKTMPGVEEVTVERRLLNGDVEDRGFVHVEKT